MKLGKAVGVIGAVLLAGVMGVSAIAWADTATGDPIKSRREKMKANGAAAGVIGPMLEGKNPFDAAKASEAAKTIALTGHEFGTEWEEYFADSSKTGDTKANPVIWDNKDDFQKRALALETDANAVVAAAATSEDAFKAAAGKMFGNCGGCHEKYRLK